VALGQERAREVFVFFQVGIVVARIFLHALPQVLLPGGILVQNSGLGSQPALEDSAEKVLLAFEMAEKGDFVETSSSSDLERGSALNTVPVQGLGRSVQESLACLIGGRRDEPIAYKLRS